jgi:hypothetical protein
MPLREIVGQALRATWGEKTPWDSLSDRRKQPWLEMADSALAAIEQDRKKRRWWK